MIHVSHRFLSHPLLQDYTPPSLTYISRARPTPSQHEQQSSPSPSPHGSSILYPVLLSCVAEALRLPIAHSGIVKDGLTYTYKNTFDGRQAVNKIAYIIKTTDRNLVPLLGRALEYFNAITRHDATSSHTSTSSAHASEARSTRVNFPHHQSPLIFPRVRVPPPLTHALSQVRF